MIANTLALLVGYVLYTPIAHGPTGSHPHGLTAGQIVAHSVALAIVAVLVVVAQRLALRPYGSVPWTRMPMAAVAFIAAFWIGSYQPWLTGPDGPVAVSRRMDAGPRRRSTARAAARSATRACG